MIFKKKEFSSNSIEYIVVGLGNPGKQYEGTRHNAGFISLDYIADELGVKVNKIKFKSTVGKANISGKRCLLMKPSTYMNLSGQAVTEAMRFYKIPPQQVIVISDDISLDVGKIRIRRKGSDGGQKGLQNIIYLSGSDEFPRVKVGIGKKPHPDYDLKDWVLSRFTDKDKKLIAERLPDIRGAVELIVSGDIDKAMNLYN
ncbi:aminoacyl-tRNA hydrolase [uncultured Ruminococcus sp.]|uniref:aminoacyl-tRNA hydrolase n=1 Tax=uncultured Ruminococcus sp. TaxID=165186 RepID=UPI00292FF42E|nr:aminoacyl-tRNA hydrolase [uncultured Ruminococcus sp.]